MNIWLLIQRVLALFLFILLLPFFGVLGIVLKIQNGGPLIFKQKRMGKDGKSFVMHKIRTMVVGADKLKKKYLHLNEVDGPVFKIHKDPRLTKIGKILVHTAVDEFPQLINVIKGEMAIVGPRPLPWDEAKKVPKRYQKRFSVLPGITSSWIVKGSHSLTFKEWMELDLDYVNNHTVFQDLSIIIVTAMLMLKWAIRWLINSRKLN
jgi:lipopolysaccharide/colanic/teichoic acid biosynthesis glycosyltransferase